MALEILWISIDSVLLYFVLLVLVNLKFNVYTYQSYYNDYSFKFEWHETDFMFYGALECALHLAYWVTVYCMKGKMTPEEKMAFY